jgi:hypothetical protein
LLKETLDPIEAWKLPKRFYLMLFSVIRVCSLKYSKAAVRAAKGSSSGNFFLLPNLSYLTGKGDI